MPLKHIANKSHNHNHPFYMSINVINNFQYEKLFYNYT